MPVIPGVIIAAVLVGLVASAAFDVSTSTGLPIEGALAPTDPAMLIFPCSSAFGSVPRSPRPSSRSQPELCVATATVVTLTLQASTKRWLAQRLRLAEQGARRVVAARGECPRGAAKCSRP
jgi:NhaP-type Na+/H+ or K+/H+ antiporter